MIENISCLTRVLNKSKGNKYYQNSFMFSILSVLLPQTIRKINVSYFFGE